MMMLLTEPVGRQIIELLPLSIADSAAATAKARYGLNLNIHAPVIVVENW